MSDIETRIYQYNKLKGTKNDNVNEEIIMDEIFKESF